MWRLSLAFLLVAIHLLECIKGSSSENAILRRKRDLQESSGLAEAFLCDQQFDEIITTEPFPLGSRIRICVKTNLRARLQGISIAKVGNFHLLKELDGYPNVEQTLIQDGIETSFQTLLNCQPGSILCYFDTVPSDDFFGANGEVLVIGNIFMQAGIQENFQPSSDSLRGSNRILIEPQSLLDQVQIVETTFVVGDGLNAASRLANTFSEHWANSPAYIKALYIFGFILLIAISIGIVLGLCMWGRWFSHLRKPTSQETENDEAEETSVSKDDHSGTFVGDEESHLSKDTKETNTTTKTKPDQIYVKRPRSRNGIVLTPPLKKGYQSRSKTQPRRDEKRTPMKAKIERNRQDYRKSPLLTRNPSIQSASTAPTENFERARRPRPKKGRNDPAEGKWIFPTRRQRKESAKHIEKPASMQWLEEKNQKDASPVPNRHQASVTGRVRSSRDLSVSSMRATPTNVANRARAQSVLPVKSMHSVDTKNNTSPQQGRRKPPSARKVRFSKEDNQREMKLEPREVD